MYIAHRGLWNKEFSENSLSAFTNAINHNYPIELDIQLTKDNQLIVLHDDNLKRVVGVDKKIKDLSLKEIKNYYILNSKEKIPTLKEVLELVNGQVLLDIEIKHYNKMFKTTKSTFKTLTKYKGIYTIKSFNPIIPWYYKRLDKNIKCGVLAGNHPKVSKFIKSIFKNLKYLWFYKPDFVCYNINEVNDYIIKKLKKYHIPLYLYTIRNYKDLLKSKEITDTFVFENIDPK